MPTLNAFATALTVWFSVANAAAQLGVGHEQRRALHDPWEQSTLANPIGHADETKLEFRLPGSRDPIRNASVRIYASATGGAFVDVELYGVRKGQGAPIRLGVQRIGAGSPLWYDWDVTAFAARAAALGSGRMSFSLRAARACARAFQIAGMDGRNRPELRTVQCTHASCPAWAAVYVGNETQRVANFEAWLGRPVDAVLAFTGHQSWSDYDGSIGWAAAMWKSIDRPMLWSIPLFPRGGNLADAASGAYDSHYARAAEQLLQFRPGDAVLYIRTAWEWNGDWFPWSVQASDVQSFVSAFRRFVEVFRGVSARFRFDWCPSIGRVAYPWERAYPGNAYVDVIGIDVYDETRWSAIADPHARFVFERRRDHGLDWLAGFAARMKKPLSVAEWGTGGSGAGDNAAFIEHMHDWLLSHDVVYQVYWNSNASYPGELSGGQYPVAAAAYRARFGPQPSRNRSSLRSNLRNKSPSQ